MKFLIVDNSRAMRRIVLRTIRQAGFENAEFIEAENGREAIELTKSEAPDLILSDWNLPEVSGLKFLKELQAGEQEIPFGFVTSEGTPEMVEQATAGGALFLLVKPFTADDMAQVLGAVIAS